MDADFVDGLPAWVMILAILITLVGALTGKRLSRSGVGVLFGAMLGPAFFLVALLVVSPRT